jgi:drug/metabolite transporter (DMT)-like permease
MSPNVIAPAQSAQPKAVPGTVYAALIVALIFWASSAPVTKIALHDVAPGEAMLARFLIASLLLALTRPGLPNPRDLGALAMIGLFSIAIYNTLMTIGLTSESSATAGVVTGLMPVFTALSAQLLLRQKPSPLTWIGLSLSLTGVVLSANQSLFPLHFTPGLVLMVLGAFGAGWGMNLQKPLLEQYTPAQVTTWAVWLGTFALLVFAPGLAASLPASSLESGLALLYLGVLPSGLAYALWAYGLKSLSTTQASSLLYALPLLTLMVAWRFGETPTALGIGGALLALLGILVIFKGPKHV